MSNIFTYTATAADLVRSADKMSQNQRQTNLLVAIMRVDASSVIIEVIIITIFTQSWSPPQPPSEIVSFRLRGGGGEDVLWGQDKSKARLERLPVSLSGIKQYRKDNKTIKDNRDN